MLGIIKHHIHYNLASISFSVIIFIEFRNYRLHFINYSTIINNAKNYKLKF